MTLDPDSRDTDPFVVRPLQDPPMRASDADRLATVRVLQDADVRGLLTPDEADQRMATAFATVHLRDLGPLTADLPPAQPAGVPAPGWRPLALMAVAQVRASLRDTVTGRPHPARFAATVLLVLLLVAVLAFVLGGAIGEALDLD